MSQPMNIHRFMDLTFPERDESLARVITRLSEPDAGRVADNLITNEDSFANVAADLARLAPRHSVYLGVGPDQNFTYIAHARPTLAFIVDFRRRNALLHLAHKALMMLSPDRLSYLSRLLARKPGKPADGSASALVDAFEGRLFDRSILSRTTAEVADVLRPLGVVHDDEWPDLAKILARLAGPGLNGRFLALPMYPPFAKLIQARDRHGSPAHFLANDETYQTLREAQNGDRVIPLVGDFAGDLTLRSLADWLRGRSLKLGVLAISDVEFFLLRDGKFPTYAANLAALPWAEGAMLLRTSTREIPHPERIQGESSTTILRPVAPFVEAAVAGRVGTMDDLFRN